MALPLKTADASETEELSDPKIVKFVVVKKGEEQAKEELTSFEEAMLPHLDAAHNLAKWLAYSQRKQWRRTSCKEHIYASRAFGGFRGTNGGLVTYDRSKYRIHFAKEEPLGRSDNEL